MENLIGKRVLISVLGSSYSAQKVDEFKVLEISPSKRWVKVMDKNGQKFWRDATTFTPIEILADLEKYPNDK